tara:strand:+ start:465 stop:668 length:204 start_codon:yes stop_codon:yes gene_type:complete
VTSAKEILKTIHQGYYWVIGWPYVRALIMTELCYHVLDNGYCDIEKDDDDEPYCSKHMKLYEGYELD